MLKLLVAVAFCLAQLAHAEKNPECAKGPVYWCQSVQNANDCHAYKHCLQSVWSKHASYVVSVIDDSFLAKTNNPNQCANCIQCLLNKLQRCPYIHQFNGEVEEMHNYGITPTATCRLLRQCPPVQEQPQQQQRIIKSPAVVETEPELIRSHHTDRAGDFEVKPDARFACGLHPRNWCDSLETATRCSAYEQCLTTVWAAKADKATLREPSESTNEQDAMAIKSCAFCVYVVEKLQSLFTEQKEVNVKKYLTSSCSLLPNKDMVDKCVNAVNLYFEKINDMAKKNLDPAVICKLMTVCDAKCLKEKETKPMPVHVDEIDSSATAAEQAKSIAKALGQINLAVLNPSEPGVLTHTPLHQASKYAAEKMRGKTMGVGCELCTIVFNGAKFLFDNKVDQEVILKFVEKELCTRLGAMNETCTQYVELEGETLIRMLEEEIDTSFICREMGMCLQSQVGEGWKKASGCHGELKFYDLNVRNDLNCTLCKLVVNQVRTMLIQKESEQRILDYVNKRLCAKTGKSEETCKSLVDAYGPVLLHLIAQDIHPEQLCDMIGMCKAAKSKQQPAGISNESDENNASESVEMAQLTPAKATVAKAVDSDAECLLCEFAMNLLAKELKSNKTEPEIEALLRGVCNKRIPSKFKNQCNAFIDQYGPIIIELIVNEVEPEKICVAISLCPGPAAVGVQRPPSAHNRFKDEEHLFKMRQRERAQNKQRAMSEPRPAKFFTDDERKDKSLLGKNVGNNTIECSLCVYVAEMIDAALAQNKTEEQIVGELLLVCNLFPGDLKSQCSAFIHEYGPYILKLIASDLEPQETCEELKLCPVAVSKHDVRETMRKLLKKERRTPEQQRTAGKRHHQ